ncbi:DUF302 domain-containing protein [Skermania sp. ID1734]|nr:DUF302 domain-containing protein [Skermania sp. ID1734]
MPIGLLLPCNVVIRRDRTTENTVVVEAMNPAVLVEVTGEPGLRDIATEAATRLQAALEAVAAQSD